MKKNIITVCSLWGILALLTGVLYPMIVTGVAQLFFPFEANGSFIMDHKTNKIMACSLIGQSFTQTEYFWGRPNRIPMSASNPLLVSKVGNRINELHRHEPLALIPVDLVMASASGVDPHISPQAALYQVKRVAKARHMSEKSLINVIERFTQTPVMGLGGEPCVNVVSLNNELNIL